MPLRNVLSRRNLPTVLALVFWSGVQAGLPSWNGAYARDDEYPDQEKFWASERNESLELKPDEDFFISFEKDKSSFKENEFDDSGQVNDRPWMKGKSFKMTNSLEEKPTKYNSKSLGNGENMFGNYNKELDDGQKTISAAKVIQNSPYSKDPYFFPGDLDSANSKDYQPNSPSDEQVNDENLLSKSSFSNNSHELTSRPSLNAGVKENEVSALSPNGVQRNDDNSPSVRSESAIVQDHISRHEGATETNGNTTSNSLQTGSNNQLGPVDGLVNVAKEDVGKLYRQSSLHEDYSEEIGKDAVSKMADQSPLLETKANLAQNTVTDYSEEIGKDAVSKMADQRPLLETKANLAQNTVTDYSEEIGKDAVSKMADQSPLLETKANLAQNTKYSADGMSGAKRASKPSSIGKDYLSHQNTLLQNQNGVWNSPNIASSSNSSVGHRSEIDDAIKNAQLPPVSYKIPDQTFRQKSNNPSVINSDIFAKPPIKDLVEGGRKSLNFQPIAEKPENFESQNVDKSNNRQIPYHNLTNSQVSSSFNKTLIKPLSSTKLNDDIVRFQSWPVQSEGHVLLKKSAEKPERAGDSEPEEFYSFPKRNNQNSARFSNLLRKAAGRYSSSTEPAKRHKFDGSELLTNILRGEAGVGGGGRLQTCHLQEEAAHGGRLPPARLRDLQKEKAGQTRHNDAIPRYGNDVFAHPLTADDPELDIVGQPDSKKKVYHHKKTWVGKNFSKVAREVN